MGKVLARKPVHQWRQKLENFEGDWDKKIKIKGGYRLKTHQFWPIC